MVMTTPYLEIANLCKLYPDQVDTIFKTLSYFDGVNFASRARCEGLFSVGLMDDLCPPSTVFAAYNRFKGKKEMVVYEFNQHDAGGTTHLKKKIEFFDRLAS